MKMSAALGLDIKWDNAKSKMRYLKTKFQKAEEWLKATGNGVDDIGATTVKGTLNETVEIFLNPFFYSKATGNMPII